MHGERRLVSSRPEPPAKTLWERATAEGYPLACLLEPKGILMKRQTVDQVSATAALEYDSTMIGALELSSKKWVFAVQLPGSQKHT